MQKLQPHALVALTTAGTVYSWPIPADVSLLAFQNREADTVIQYSFDNFAHYYTLPAATQKTFINYRSNPAGDTIYFKGVTNSGRNVEIEYALG